MKFKDVYLWDETSAAAVIEDEEEIARMEEGDYDVHSFIIPVNIRRKDGKIMTANDDLNIKNFVNSWNRHYPCVNMKVTLWDGAEGVSSVSGEVVFQ